MIKIFLFILLLFCSIAEGTLKLSSQSFDHNGMIPIKYTCDGANISPSLSWQDAPAGTQSFALIVDDPDAPSKIWVHWILFNIPNTVHALQENVSPRLFMNGATDFSGAQNYGGPCPPTGTHKYQFTLYALDSMLNLSAGCSKQELLKAMEGHILEKAILNGRYQRVKK